MKVGELSRRSGVSVASIKYYLREGLLPPGERTSPNQAAYGDEHVHRLRLVRALIDIGGLTVAATREVLDALADPEADLFCTLGAATSATGAAPSEGHDEERERAEKALDDALRRRGWRLTVDNPSWDAAVEALATMHRLGHDDLAASLELYAGTAEGLARREVASVMNRGDRARVVEGVVVGTVLGDTLLSALRRLAHAHWTRVTLDPDDRRSALVDEPGPGGPA